MLKMICFSFPTIQRFSTFLTRTEVFSYFISFEIPIVFEMKKIRKRKQLVHDLKSMLKATKIVPMKIIKFNIKKLIFLSAFNACLLDLIECLMNYGWRFVTLCRRQG